MPTQWKIHTYDISHIYFWPTWNMNCHSVELCVFRGKRTLVAHFRVWPSMHRGVNAKPFDTSAGVALMYVTAAACFPFPQPHKAPTFPLAPRCSEQPDYHVHVHRHAQQPHSTLGAKITHSKAAYCFNMICHRSQIGLLCSARPEQQQQQQQQHWEIYEVCRQAAKKGWKTALLISTPTRLNSSVKDSYTHTNTHTEYGMVGQKRDDCSQLAMGLVVLLENPGALGLILLPLHSISLPQPASLWGCLCVVLLLFHTHTHTHTQTALSPYQKRKAALFAQTVSCSNFRCEQLVFRPARGIFTLLMSPEKHWSICLRDQTIPPAVVREGELHISLPKLLLTSSLEPPTFRSCPKK